MPHGIRHFRIALAVALSAVSVWSQDPPKPAKEKDAIKLPDGTIVFYTKAPDDPNPPIDGVRLSAKEYKALVEQSEQLKKLKDGVKPASPSECHISGKLVVRGERPVVELTITYRFRTTAPRSTVLLGGDRVFPLGARIDGETLPVLAVTDDGLTVLVERAGDHVLTLRAEAPVSARGFLGVQGFDVGLPKAAITSLTLASPYSAGAAGKRVSVSVRGGDPTSRPGEYRRSNYDAADLAREPVAVGAAEHLEATWDESSATGAVSPATAVVETNVAVQVEDTLVETTAKVRLKGDAARSWEIVLPVGAVPSVERSVPAKSSDSAAGLRPIVRQTGPSAGATRWAIELPDTGVWVLTGVVRTPRPKSGTAERSGPYPIGPVAVQNCLRQTGTVRVSCPPNVRLGFTHGSELRRADPAAGEVAAFQFHTIPVGSDGSFPPLLQFTARPAEGLVLVKPQYRFRLTPAGWRLHADLRITPVRTVVSHVRIEYPADWPVPDVGPPEWSENSVADPPGPRRGTTVRFDVPKIDPFDLTLDVVLPVPAGSRAASISLPQFPGTDVRESQLVAAVPTGFELRGTIRTGPDGNGPVTDLLPPFPDSSLRPTTATLTALHPGAPTRVEFAWQPFRPSLTAEIQAEVTVQDRQYIVSETITVRSAESITSPLRLRGPTGVVGLRVVPMVTPGGPGEWTIPPQLDRGKEWTVTLSYAVPVRPDAGGNVPIGIVWPEDAAQTDVEVRAWSGTDRWLSGFAGPWREAAPSPSPAHESLPHLTVRATRGPDTIPPSLVLAMSNSDTSPTRPVVDRCLIQAWLQGDGPGFGRAQFVLSRWPVNGVDLNLPEFPAEVWLDGKRVESFSSIVPADGYASSVRVPMPESKPGRPPSVLDIRFPLPKSSTVQAIPTPHVRSAVDKSRTRWEVIPPTGKVALNWSGELSTESRWKWDGGLVPVAVGTTAELDRWAADGTEPTTPGDATGLIGWQKNALKPVGLVVLPAWAWTTLCSGLVLLGGLAVIRPWKSAVPVVVGFGVLLSAAALAYPQPVAQFVAAAQPGLLAVAAVLIGQAVVRGYYHRRTKYLPGFSRALVEPVSDASGQDPVRSRAPAGGTTA